MTSIDQAPPAEHAAPTTPGTWHSKVSNQPVSLRRAMAAEWVKFRSLKSSWLILASAFVALIVLALVIAYNTRNPSPGMDADNLALSATLQGYHLGELLLGALGVLVVTAEYSSGTIRTSLVAVPKRLPVLWAKLLVVIPLVTVTMLVSAFIAFVSSEALLARYRPGWSLSDPGAVRVVIGTALYLGALTALGGAIGWIVRSTPGALVTYLGLTLVIPVIVGDLMGSFGRAVAKYLPSEAGTSFVTSIRLPDLLAPTAAAFVVLAWVVASIAVAAVVLRRRDA
jgi:ABC-type transport system involved in multi-copper enzyme maturation permease subunit